MNGSLVVSSSVNETVARGQIANDSKCAWYQPHTNAQNRGDLGDFHFQQRRSGISNRSRATTSCDWPRRRSKPRSVRLSGWSTVVVLRSASHRPQRHGKNVVRFNEVIAKPITETLPWLSIE